VAIAFAAGGCSFTYQLGSLFGDGDKATGSTRQPAARAAVADAPADLLPNGDLAYARAAVADVLGHGGKTASARWENPVTGARGTVTPIASAYDQDGTLCQDFLASYVREGAASWLQGEACRADKGGWELRSLKPWKRT
jgi:surface antigen